MSTTHPDLDITDDNEPQEISERDRKENELIEYQINNCLLYTSPSPRDGLLSRMPSSA